MNSLFDYITKPVNQQSDTSNSDNYKPNNTQSDINVIDNSKPKFFNIDKFVENLKSKSIKSNFDRMLFSDNINAYDIAHNCINQTLYRLYNTPIPAYEDVWLPVQMRQVIGSAIHEFIQSNYEFDEIEVAVKVEKYKFSGRIDAIFSNNTIVEIKSVPYNDYKSIVNQNAPREKDLYQTLIYKHLLENNLQDIIQYKNKLSKEEQQKYNWPKQDSYNIQYIQFIYIAHDLISSDISSISEALYIQREIKKKLNSKYNKFFFIHTITIDLNKSKEYYTQIENNLVNKLHTILSYLDKHRICQSIDETPYINTKQCFFCLYKHICPIKSK